jgi:SAM-dependent methyltransferase
MANNNRKLHRLFFPTAHKLALQKITDSKLRRVTGSVLVVGAGYDPYKDLLKSASAICVTDIGPIHQGLDQLADAQELPFPDSSFDAVVAIEVFEHVRKPAAAAREIYRVLRMGGRGLLSIPFMFHVHGDPSDYQRFTSTGISELFEMFSAVQIQPFGGRLHAISDIITTAFRAFAMLRIANHLLALPALSAASGDCPSGYVVELVK